MNDSVNHPRHYTKGGLEVIDILKKKLTSEQFKGLCLGSAIQYIFRSDMKGGKEDLMKAIWYLNMLIK